MNVTVVIATYGDHEWSRRAWGARASVADQTDEIFVIHCDECSIAQARNSAARWGNGEWLCFLDADDELAPGYLDAMRRAFEQERSDGDLLLTPAVQFVRKGRRWEPHFLDRVNPLTDDNWLVVGTLIRRELFERVGGFSDFPHGFEDFSLWSKAWRIGARVVKVPDAVYVYNINPRSKHKIGWRNKAWQRATHYQVIAELDAWEREYKAALVA